MSGAAATDTEVAISVIKNSSLKLSAGQCEACSSVMGQALNGAFLKVTGTTRSA